MLKRNLIALSRMLGIPGLVVMTEQGAVARQITSSTLTITNPDGVDGDINIEGSGGGGGATSETAFTIYNKILAWWERDETSGTVMTDSHINGLHGTYSGLIVNQAGLGANLGQSVTFPAGNNYAEVQHNMLLCPTHNMAVMVWAKRNGAQATFPKLVWKPAATKASGHGTYLLTQDNNTLGGKVQFRITIGSTSFTATSTTALADATPYMLLGNRTFQEAAIWVNGTKEGTVQITATANAADVSTLEHLRFGYHGSAGDPWVGAQDQCALFKDFLTPSEVAYLYNGGAGRTYVEIKAAAGF